MTKLFIRMQMRVAASRIETLQRERKRIEREYRLDIEHSDKQIALAVEYARKLRAELYAIEHPAVIQ